MSGPSYSRVNIGIQEANSKQNNLNFIFSPQNEKIEKVNNRFSSTRDKFGDNHENQSNPSNMLKPNSNTPETPTIERKEILVAQSFRVDFGDYIPPLYSDKDEPKEYLSRSDNKKNMPDLGNKNTDFDQSYVSVSTLDSHQTGYQGQGQTPLPRNPVGNQEINRLKENIQKQDFKVIPEEKKIPDPEPSLLKARDLPQNTNPIRDQYKNDYSFKRDTEGASSTYYSLGTEKTGYALNSQLQNRRGEDFVDNNLLKEDIKKQNLTINPTSKQFQDNPELYKARDLDPASSRQTTSTYLNKEPKNKEPFVRDYEPKSDLSKKPTMNDTTFYSIGSNMTQYNDNSNVNLKGVPGSGFDLRLKEDIMKGAKQINPETKKFDPANPEFLKAKELDPFGGKSKNYGGLEASPFLSQPKPISNTNIQKSNTNEFEVLSDMSKESFFHEDGKIEGIFGRTYQENFKIKEDILSKDNKLLPPAKIDVLSKNNVENSLTSAYTILTSEHGGERIPNFMENTQHMELNLKSDLNQKKKTDNKIPDQKIVDNAFPTGDLIEKGPYFNVQRQKGTSKNLKTGEDFDGPLIKNITVTRSDYKQHTDSSDDRVLDRDRSLQPTLNWEPVVLGKKDKLNFHPEFNTYNQQLGNSISDDIFLPKYRLEQAKQDFISEMDNLDKDPSYKRINVAFVKNGPDGEGRRVYPFHVKINDGTIYDLKRAIMNDFGYQLDQQRIFHKYLEVDDGTFISEMKFEQGEILLFGSVGFPAEKNTVNFRQRINERTIEEIAEMNCSNLTREEFEAFTSDENLIWPPYRNWTKEWAILHAKSRELKREVEKLESLESHIVSELMQFEREIHELIKAFSFAANRVVHNIFNWKSDPVFLDNLHGKGGKKFVAGGMVVRECRDWIILTEEVSEGENAYKIACNENRALNFIRGKIEGVECPLSSIIVKNGISYFVQSLCPITERTIVYGSNTEGIELVAEEEGKIVADAIALHFNLKDHIVYDRVEKKGKYFSMPFDSEIHFADDGLIYFLNPVRAFAPDVDDIEEGSLIHTKFFRPEFQCNYSSGEVDSDYMLITWQNPTGCSECGELITDYDYFYYQKKMLDKNRTLFKEYYCCIKCYMRLKPYDGFKVPSNQIIQKTLPIQERKTKWINMRNQEITETMPLKLLPFNPDAYVLFPEFAREEDKKYILKENKEDRSSLLIASQKLKEDTVQKFILELNNLEVILVCSCDLTENLHKRGINLRHLGILVLDVKHNFMREVIMREILSRSIKVLIRDAQSFLRDKVIDDSNIDSQKLIIKYLNEIFTGENRQSSREIWELLADLVKKKFKISVDKSILTKIQPVPLLHMIATKLNIRMNRNKIYDFKLQFPFSMQDIVYYSNFVKVKNDYSYCIEIALKRAREKDAAGKRTKWFLPGGPERAIATEIFRQAAVMAEFIFEENNILTAKIYKEFANHLEERHAEKGRPEYSRWNRCAGVSDDALSVDARLYYKKALKSFEANDGYEFEVANCWLGLARLQKENVSKLPLALGENENTMKFLINAIQIYEIYVGVDHPDTAHLYFFLAYAYKERARIEESYPWMKKAFCLYFRIFGPDDEATILAFDATKAMGMYLDPNIETISIEDMCQYLEDQEFQQN